MMPPSAPTARTEVGSSMRSAACPRRRRRACARSILGLTIYRRLTRAGNRGTATKAAAPASAGPPARAATARREVRIAARNRAPQSKDPGVKSFALAVRELGSFTTSSIWPGDFALPSPLEVSMSFVIAAPEFGICGGVSSWQTSARRSAPPTRRLCPDDGSVGREAPTRYRPRSPPCSRPTAEHIRRSAPRWRPSINSSCR